MIDSVLEELRGKRPADLEAICKVGRRSALRRLPKGGHSLPTNGMISTGL
jgi:hypothetical protein